MSEQIQKCKSCQAPIVWMETSKGKKMPVDYSEKVALFVDFTKPVFNPKTMTSHFATCPNASQHRKGKQCAAN